MADKRTTIEEFAREIAKHVQERPVSLPVRTENVVRLAADVLDDYHGKITGSAVIELSDMLRGMRMELDGRPLTDDECDQLALEALTAAMEGSDG